MLKRSAVALAVTAAVWGLSGCAESDVTVAEGVLLDAEIQGVSYKSGTQSGVTGSDGKFKYEVGQPVTFSVDGLTLGTVDGAEFVTPIELTGDSSAAGAGALAMARLLQSLDEDDNPDNGIKVNRSRLATGVRAPQAWADADDSALQALLADGMSLRNTADAWKHFHTQQASKRGMPEMTLVGRLAGDANAGASRAEIIAFHKASKSSFHIVAGDSIVERLDLSTLGTTALANPTSAANLTVAATVNVASHVNGSEFTAGGVQSVAIAGDLMAVAVQGTPKTSAGRVALYQLAANGSATYLRSVTVGAQPDSLSFSPDGLTLVVANEGELSDTFATDGVDPEGSITVIKLTTSGAVSSVTALDFQDFNTGGARAAELSADLRIGRAGASVAQDLEPEYVAISADGKQAFVTLQENNGVAVVDLANVRIDKVVSLGFKDFGLARNAFAPSDKVSLTPNPLSALKTYPNVYGVRMPDGIAAFTIKGKTYFVTANEGDDRDDFLNPDETARVSTLTLDATAFPDAVALKADTALGRLTVMATHAQGKYGDTDNDGDYDKLYVLGARSFSIFDAESGALVFDSGDDLERLVFLDAMNDANSAALLSAAQIKGRLDNKGPEPETVVMGEVRGKPYLFVALERASGIVMVDMDNPQQPKVVRYFRNSSNLTDGDISPEGLKFIAAADSPTGKALLLAGYEVSGTVAVIQID